MVLTNDPRKVNIAAEAHPAFPLGVGFTISSGDTMIDTLPTYEKGQRVVGPARTTMTNTVKDMYVGGMNIRAIATDLGRSYGFVHRILTAGNVELRSRGGHRPRKPTTTAAAPEFTEPSEQR